MDNLYFDRVLNVQKKKATYGTTNIGLYQCLIEYLMCVRISRFIILNRGCVQVRIIARKPITLRPASSRLVTEIVRKDRT